MHHFIAISFSDRARSEEHSGLSAKVMSALNTLNCPSPVMVENHPQGMFACSGKMADHAVRNPDGRFMMNCGHTVVSARLARPLSADELSRVWVDAQGNELTGLAAPFALCGRRTPGAGYQAITDRYGLMHVYGWQGRSVAVISSSAILIGRIFDLELDTDSAGIFAQLGHQLDNQSPVKGVKKCRPTFCMDIYDGRLRSRPGFAPLECGERTDQFDFEAGIEILRNAVNTHIRAFPDCEIELSGGIDSRLLLSAIPRKLRKDRTAVTLGSPNSPDVRIAAKIAARFDMRHRVIDVSKIDHMPGDDLLKTLQTGSLRHDHAANAVDKLTLECLRTELGNAPRISGQNGEVCRGFYYPGQPLSGRYQDSHLRKLLTWRLAANDSINPNLFTSDAGQKIDSLLFSTFKERLRIHTPWSSALDHLYLDQRMQRWCGAAVSAASHQRPILMPFFDPDFVQWAFAAPAVEKRHSRLACRLIDSLDSELSRLPLDSGLSPRQVIQTGPLKWLRMTTRTGRKMAQHTQMKLTGSRRHNLGTGSITDRLKQFGSMTSINWSALESTGMFDRSLLQKYGAGDMQWDRATLGVLFALSFTIEHLTCPLEQAG